MYDSAINMPYLKLYSSVSTMLITISHARSTQTVLGCATPMAVQPGLLERLQINMHVQYWQD